MSTAFIPETYEQWHQCITVDCAIPLTKHYIEKQLAVLQDQSNHYTQQFIRLYGQVHHKNVVDWFGQAGARA